MTAIRGWAKQVYRAHGRVCTLASYGHSYTTPGVTPPTDVHFMFERGTGKGIEQLEVSITTEDEARDIIKACTEFLSRRGASNDDRNASKRAPVR